MKRRSILEKQRPCNVSNNSNAHYLFRKPDILVVIVGWIYLVIMNLIFLNVVDYDYTFYVFYILAAVFTLIFGLSKPRSIKSTLFKVNTKLITSNSFLIICGLIGLIGSVMLYKASPFSGLGLSIEEIRDEFNVVGGTFSYLNYGNILFTPFYLIGAFLASFRKKLDVPIVIFILMFFVGVYFNALTNGGRVNALVMFFFSSLL